MKYEVQNGGVSINGSEYAEGHVFDLSDEQAQSSAFAEHIEAGTIKAVELSEKTETTMNENTENTGAENTASDQGAENTGSENTSNENTSNEGAASTEGEGAQGEQA